MVVAGLTVAVLSTTACASQGATQSAGQGQAAFLAAGIQPQAEAAPDYRIGPQDVEHHGFSGQGPDGREDPVDGSGRIYLPLIGSVIAAGKTTQELSTEIADRLKGQLQSPQVSVSVAEAVSQKVTVDGSRSSLVSIP